MSPWIVSLLSLVAALVVLALVVIVLPGYLHTGASDFDNGEELGRASGKVAFVIAIAAFFLQRRRVRRYEEQARGRSV